jgi:hypothetical protein
MLSWILLTTITAVFILFIIRIIIILNKDLGIKRQKIQDVERKPELEKQQRTEKEYKYDEFLDEPNSSIVNEPEEPYIILNKSFYRERGKLYFDYPKTMKTHTKYRVSVAISRLKQISLQDSSTGEIYFIQISDIMKCILKGDAFNIEPLSTETQGLLDDMKTGWQWGVKPLKKGRQQLILVVSMQLNIQDQIAMKDIPVLERDVMVKINTPEHIKKIVQKNWQWFVGVVLGSGILWQLLKMFVFKEK